MRSLTPTSVPPIRSFIHSFIHQILRLADAPQWLFLVNRTHTDMGPPHVYRYDDMLSYLTKGDVRSWIEGRRVTLQVWDARPQNLQLPPRMPHLSVLIKHESCLQFPLWSTMEEASFPSIRIHVCQSQESPECLSNITLLLEVEKPPKTPFHRLFFYGQALAPGYWS